MNLFIHEPKSLENLVAISRSIEVFGFKKPYIYDSNHLVKSKRDYGKHEKRKINNISAGGFFHLDFTPILDPINFVKTCNYRTIATSLRETSTSLYNLSFQENDLIIMGNETNGLPKEILNIVDLEIKIPQKGFTQSLNLAASTAIFLFEMNRQEFFNTKTNNNIVN